MNNTEIRRPVIGITMGDPAGNGPELCVQALLHKAIYEECRPLIVGDANVIEKAAVLLGHPELTVHRVDSVEQAAFTWGIIDVYHLDLVDLARFEYGKVSAMCGRAAFECVRKVIELALDDEVDATCTNALNKEAMNLALAPEGMHFDGHTEIYAHYTHTEKYTMLLAHHDLRVVHVSTHCSLREACDRVKSSVYWMSFISRTAHAEASESHARESPWQGSTLMREKTACSAGRSWTRLSRRSVPRRTRDCVWTALCRRTVCSPRRWAAGMTSLWPCTTTRGTFRSKPSALYMTGKNRRGRLSKE